MEIHKNFKTWKDIEPDEIYSIREATKYLGIHRCTIYAYISHPERPLPFHISTQTARKLFRGADLIAYKSAGLPKKGRKRNRDNRKD